MKIVRGDQTDEKWQCVDATAATDVVRIGYALWKAWTWYEENAPLPPP